MSRAQIISQTIQSFNSLRNQTDKLFLETNSNSEINIMADELFESKLNPFLRELYKTIRNIPLNDYTIIAIDSWIKELNCRIETIKSDADNANGIPRKYLPKIIDTLNDIKLEILELLLSEHAPFESSNKNQYNSIESKSPLTPQGVAMLLVQLQNFGVIKRNIPIASIVELLAPLLGNEAYDIVQHIYFDKENRRQSAKANRNDLSSLVKVLKSIIGRIENQQYVSSTLENETS